MALPITIALCADVLPLKPLDDLSPSNLAVFSLLAESEFSLGDLEMPITDRGSPVQKLFNMRAPSSVAPSLSKLGLRAVTLANNHAGDYGWAGLFDTRQAVQEQGIRTVGTGIDVNDAVMPLIEHVKGTRVGVLAFSCLTPTGVGAGPNRPGISALHVKTAYEIDPWYQMEEPGDPACVRIRTEVRAEDLHRAVRAIRQAKLECDTLIVTIHWGFGSTEALAEYQRPLAEALIDAGADIIHGHHAHAVQAFGFHKQKPIIYSANVLVGQQVFLDASEPVKAIWRDMSSDGYVTLINWQDGKIQEIELRPTVLDANRLPEFAKDADAKRIMERIARLSLGQGGRINIKDDRVLIQATD